MSKKLTYSEALTEIEEIVANIENDAYSIDELTEKVKKISILIKFCKEKLRSTEDEVNKILTEEE